MQDQAASRQWRRYRDAIAGERLPLALVDLDALDTNIAHFRSVASAGGKGLRVATKSLRSVALIRYVAQALGRSMCGLMTYDALETELLAKEGFRDLLLAYPTLQPSDLA